MRLFFILGCLCALLGIMKGSVMTLQAQHLAEKRMQLMAFNRPGYLYGILVRPMDRHSRSGDAYMLR